MRKNHRIANIVIPLFLSLVGFAYLVYYIFRASVDVVASDYIRIINYYVKDVTDLRYLLSWEGISCIPFTFLARFINVKFFNYSVIFDKILGIVGLVIFNFVTVKYALENISSKHVKIITSIIITFISFSLMAWEMILNGTGYPHFITIGLIALTFYSVSQQQSVVVSPQESVGAVSHASPLLIVVTSLLFAGSYSVAYLVTLMLFGLFVIIWARPYEKNASLEKPVGANIASQFVTIVISLICLVLYFKSSSSGEQLVPVGFQDVTLKEVIEADASFPIRFMVCSFASALIGVETLTFAAAYGSMTMNAILIFGAIYMLIMLWTLLIIIGNFKNFRRGEYCEPDESRKGDAFAYLYIIYGLINFVLVFFARYKFVRADYGMSSRYAIQYMFLTIGMILILSKIIDTIIVDREFNIKRVLVILISFISIFTLVFGHIITTTDEMYKTNNRKLVYEFVADVAKNYRDYNDDQLKLTFEYFRSADHIREALGTLEEKHLNIFK